MCVWLLLYSVWFPRHRGPLEMTALRMMWGLEHVITCFFAHTVTVHITYTAISIITNTWRVSFTGPTFNSTIQHHWSSLFFALHTLENTDIIFYIRKVDAEKEMCRLSSGTSSGVLYVNSMSVGPPRIPGKYCDYIKSDPFFKALMQSSLGMSWSMALILIQVFTLLALFLKLCCLSVWTETETFGNDNNLWVLCALTILPTMMILGPSCLWMAKIWIRRSVKTIKSMAITARPNS